MNAAMLEKYFNRIGLKTPCKTDFDCLKEIHELQHKRIPFENFDVINKNPILLSENDLIEKLVVQSRGGYCFELNGLLLSALKTIGFQVRPLLGRVHSSGPPSGRGHLVSLVTINEQQWIVDAGFGAQTPRAPLPLRLDEEFYTDIQTFRFVENESVGILLQTKHDNEWIDLYSLDMTYVCEGDVEYGNYYTSTNRNSVFTSCCVAAIRTDNGRITLLNNKLKIKSDHETREIILDSEKSYFSALKEYFGITLDVPYNVIKAHI